MIKSNDKDLYGKIIAETIESPQVIGELLYNRNLKDEKEIYKYFLKDDELTNPFELPNMKKATERVAKAVSKNEKIVIYGDYDADGILASSLLFLFLKRSNANVDIFIPAREDGYGLSKKNIKKVFENYEADLLISVDTGITAKKEVTYAKELGLDIIITDHHEIQIDKIPDAFAVINPKLLKNDKYNLKILAGAGVAYFFVRALNSKIYNGTESLKDYLVLATLATISDMVPLIANNRILVDRGLELLYETDIIGLNMLLDKIYFFNYPTAKDVGYKIVPLINASARMNKTEVAINLFTENNMFTYKIAEDLIKLNEERKKQTQIQYTEALKIVNKNQKNSSVLIIYSEKFTSGLIGLIANKIAEEFNKPTIVMAKEKNVVKGSMRNGGNPINLLDYINEIKSDIIEGGGHADAAGFSVKPNKIIQISKKIKNLKIEDNKSKLEDDFEITIDVNEPNLYEINKYIYRMEPFGIGNKNPLIKFINIKKVSDAKLTQGGHIYLKINKYLNFYCFFPDNKQKAFLQNIIQKEKEEFSIIAEVYSNGYNISGYIHKFINKENTEI